MRYALNYDSTTATDYERCGCRYEEVYWTEDRSDGFCSKMAGQLGARAGDLVAFGRVEYDLERAASAIRESELPDDFAAR